MVYSAQKVQWIELESELEALLTEAELIRTYQPQFNVLLKDDKSNLYVWITNETFPRVLTIRKKEILTKHPKGTILGPFQSAYKVKEVLKIARKIFPWCNQNFNRNYTQKTIQEKNLEPCFYKHIELCPGACTGLISEEEYQETIKNLILFLRGKTNSVLKSIKADMHQASQDHLFEKAAKLRDQYALVEEVTKKSYKLKPELQLTRSLSSNEGKDRSLHLSRLLAMHTQVPRGFSLKRIEGYDVSNTSGTQASVSQVVFTNGEADKKEYRLYNIRTLNTPNDYHMMKEAIIRRQNHSEWGVPDLVIIDGGKGQLRAALSVWRWGTPMISIAKNPDRIIIPQLNFSELKKGIPKNLHYQIITLKADQPALQLVAQVRNESHRFSKKQHTNRRLKKMLE